MTAEKDLEAWVARCGMRVVEMLLGRREGAIKFGVDQITASAQCMVLKVTTKEKAAAVKAFKNSHPSATDAFDRELAMLNTLKNTGLVPRLLGHSKADGTIVMTWVEGQTLSQALTPETLVDLAGKIGTWLGAFTVRMQKAPIRNDWYSYLSNYDEFNLGGALANHKKRLGNIRFSGLATAKNDAFADNFIVTPDGSLIGIDFEAASMKPVGWDVLLTARVFLKMFPDQAETAIDALVDGWDVNRADTKDWRDLALIFARASVHLEQDTGGTV